MANGLDDGGGAEVGPVRVDALASAHERIDRDGEGRCRHLGYVVRVGSWRIYHSGDTVRYAGMAERLREHAPDVALLPINGRDPARGVAGNLDGPEAATLARDAGAGLVVPCHYEGFAFEHRLAGALSRGVRGPRAAVPGPPRRRAPSGRQGLTGLGDIEGERGIRPGHPSLDDREPRDEVGVEHDEVGLVAGREPRAEPEGRTRRLARGVERGGARDPRLGEHGRAAPERAALPANWPSGPRTLTPSERTIRSPSR